jgi:nitroreductase
LIVLKAKIMTVNSIIKDRWSPVAFSEDKIDESIMEILFEAARWAPSSFNAQPWKFIWGSKGELIYSLLFELLNENNQQWAKTAPVLILSIAETIHSGRSNKNRFAHYDTGMAVGNLLAQATDKGLFIHQMGGYNNTKAKELFNMPEAFEPMAMMALGYKGSPTILPEDIAKRENRIRERKPLEEFVFKGKF